MTHFDEMFDFVVVGSGGGSMCAGLVMRAAGKSVLILEKTPLVGGTTARSGGVMWIPNNPFMTRDGIEDSHEKAATYLDAVLPDPKDAPGASRARRATYLTEAPRMLEFLASRGVKLTRVKEWPDYYDDLPGGSVPGRTVVAELFDANELGAWTEKLRPSFVHLPIPASLEEMLELPAMKRSWAVKMLLVKLVLRGVVAKITGKRWVAGGAALQGRMLQAALREGIEIRTDSPVTQILVEDGRATGVATVKDGRPWRVGARLGVLVNAGGFAHNQQMRDRYQPGTSVKWTMAAPGDTGEMIEEMMRHGAAVAQMQERVGNQFTPQPGWEESEFRQAAQSVTAAPHCHTRRPKRRALHERGRLVHGLLQGDARAQQERARRAELGGVRCPVPAQVHIGRHDAGHQEAATLVRRGLFADGRQPRGIGPQPQDRSGDAQGHRGALQRLRGAESRRGLSPRRARL